MRLCWGFNQGVTSANRKEILRSFDKLIDRHVLDSSSYARFRIHMRGGRTNDSLGCRTFADFDLDNSTDKHNVENAGVLLFSMLGKRTPIPPILDQSLAFCVQFSITENIIISLFTTCKYEVASIRPGVLWAEQTRGTLMLSTGCQDIGHWHLGQDLDKTWEVLISLTK